MIRSRSTARMRRALTKTLLSMEREVLRSTTRTQVLRGLADLQKYGDLLGQLALPATELSVANYLVFSVTCREPDTLDSSTVLNYAQGQSLWHDMVREQTGLPLVNPYKTRRVRRMLKHLGNHYKKPSKAKLPWSIAQMRRMYRHGYPDTRSGRHRCLTLMFSNVGMLRKNASRRLTCTYELLPRTIIYAPDSRVKVVRERGQRPLIHAAVAADKNATSKKRRDVYIPDKVRALRINCVKMLEDYLRREKPPSGGLLLAAPVGRTRFRDTPYSNHHAAFRAAYKRAFPEADDTDKFGSGSARKAMAQWLWASGWAKRVIADAGGWFCKKSAVDQYFKTQPRDILRAIRNVGLTRGQNRR